jgi:hypothetical protein
MWDDKGTKTELLRIEALRACLLDRFRHGLEGEQSFRRLILLASTLKLREQARAACILATEGFIEEILSIARTMVEVAVNAAYLQFAEEAEIGRYMNFDIQTLNKHANNLRPHLGYKLSEATRLEIERNVTEARIRTGLPDKAQNWSTKAGLIQRADFADERLGDNSISMLVRTVLAWSHRAAHGTHTSLIPFYDAFGNGTVPETAERLDEMTIALRGVNFCVYTFGLFLDRFLHYGKQTEITAAGKLLPTE